MTRFPVDAGRVVPLVKLPSGCAIAAHWRKPVKIVAANKWPAARRRLSLIKISDVSCPPFKCRQNYSFKAHWQSRRHSRSGCGFKPGCVQVWARQIADGARNHRDKGFASAATNRRLSLPCASQVCPLSGAVMPQRPPHMPGCHAARRIFAWRCCIY